MCGSVALPHAFCYVYASVDVVVVANILIHCMCSALLNISFGSHFFLSFQFQCFDEFGIFY